MKNIIVFKGADTVFAQKHALREKSSRLAELKYWNTFFFFSLEVKNISKVTFKFIFKHFDFEQYFSSIKNINFNVFFP